jgi:hypothetical protein
MGRAWARVLGHHRDAPRANRELACHELIGTPAGFVANFAQEIVKGQLPLSVGRLRGQGVEQFGGSAALVSSLHPHLSFLEHVHEINPHECVLGCLERFEPQHETSDPFYCSMILFHDIIRIFDLTDG